MRDVNFFFDRGGQSKTKALITNKAKEMAEMRYYFNRSRQMSTFSK